jgi:hypothetical protein
MIYDPNKCDMDQYISLKQAPWSMFALYIHIDWTDTNVINKSVPLV